MPSIHRNCVARGVINGVLIHAFMFIHRKIGFKRNHKSTDIHPLHQIRHVASPLGCHFRLYYDIFLPRSSFSGRTHAVCLPVHTFIGPFAIPLLTRHGNYTMTNRNFHIFLTQIFQVFISCLVSRSIWSYAAGSPEILCQFVSNIAALCITNVYFVIRYLLYN